METKASHIWIGAFVLAMVAALFAFVLWLTRAEGRNANLYDIIFTNAVDGLAPGSPVTFNGVPVGQVVRIRLVPQDPNKVRVRVAIAEKVPIYQGTTASLEAQGFTGVSYVQLSWSGEQRVPITDIGPFGAPIIHSRPSALQELFGGAPQVLEQASLVISRLSKLLSDENMQSIESTLDNIETITGAVANRSDEIERAMTEATLALAELRQATESFSRLANQTEQLMAGDGAALIADARSTVQSADQLLQRLDQTVAKAEPGLTNFSQTALPEASRLITDLRDLTRRLNDLTQRLSDNPGSALLGSSDLPTYESRDR